MNVLNKQLHCLERKLSSKLVLKIFIIQVYKFEFDGGLIMFDIATITLSANNMQALFKSTIAKPTTTQAVRCVLFTKENGFSEESRPIFFDKKDLELLTPSIEYAFGQLKDVHEGKKSTTTSSIINRYDDTIWATSSQSVLEILHLACAIGLVAPLNAETSEAKFLKDIYPTKTPRDPNYGEWYREYKTHLKRL